MLETTRSLAAKAKLRPAARQALYSSAMEMLERREMMSASIGLVNGVVTLRANASTPSKMTVELGNGGKDLVANLTGAKPVTFPMNEVSGIAMYGSADNDTMIVGRAVKIGASMNGGEGNNEILGGSGNDVIVAGNGANVIDGRGGNDSITVGNGKDSIRGNAGNDSLVAGAGPDMLSGGSGNDSMVGGAGSDRLVGGKGDDMIIAGAGTTRVSDRSGHNTIVSSSKTVVHANRNSSVSNSQNSTPTVGSSSGGTKTGAGTGTTTTGTGGTTTTGGTQTGTGGSTTGTGGITTGTGGTTTSTGGTTATTGGSKTGTGGTTTTTGGTTTTTGGTTTSTGGSKTGTGGTTTTTGGSTTTTGGTTTSTGGSKTGSGTTTSTGGTTTSTGGSTTSTGGTTTSTGGTTTSTGGTTTTTGGSTTTTSGGSTTTTGGTVTASTGSAPAFATQTTLGSDDPGDISFSAAKTLANIQVTFGTGMANHTVHFNGLGSKFANGDALDATYVWNFGDTGSRFNTLHGWIGAHNYVTAGTYTVTLSVTDKAGNTSTVSTKVTIAADTRRAIYVDSVNGSDTNSGATSSAAVATLGRAQQLLGDNSEILLHAGQTFNVPNSIVVNNTNVMISSYGTGAAPHVVKVAGTGSSIFNISASATNFVAQNLVIDSMWTVAKYGQAKVNVYGFYVTGDNFTVHDCQFLNVDDGVNTAGMPTGVLVQDNYFGTMIRGCCIWGQGYDHVYDGNTMTNSYQEHLIRMSGTGVCRVLIEDNNLSRFTPIKGSLELRTSSFFYVTGNVVNGGTLRLGLPDGETDYFTGWGVVQQNETSKIFANIRPGAEHIILRDNVFNYDAAGPAISLEPQYSVGARVISDIRVENNTLIDTSPQAKFLQIDGTGVQDVVVTNNLMIAPNIQWVGVGSGGIYVEDKNLNAFSTISGNIWPADPSSSNQPGDNYVYPVWGQVGATSGFMSNTAWNQQPQVGTDQFANISLASGAYDTTLNGVTSGALPGKFDPKAWSVAVAA